MGTCLSKKTGSSTSSPVAGANSASTAPVQASAQLKNSGNGVPLSKPKVQTEPAVNLKKEKKTVQEKQNPAVQIDEGQVKKEIFIIKHRKSHDDRERNSKTPLGTTQQNVPSQPADGLASAASSEAAELMGNKIAPATPNMGVGVRTSSCTKEEVDAILIQCGRLSRSSSGKATPSSAAFGERGRKYSGSKRSYDFDHCDNDAISADDDRKKANANANATDNSDLCEDDGAAAEKRRHQHRQRHRQSPRPSPQGRRRTPSRERDQQQRSSSRERRVSRSPGRRSSETTTSASAPTANASNNGNTSCRPGKMVSVPATVSSLVMDKSNNGVGGGESAATTGIKRITVKRNVGDSGMVGSRSAASPRSQSPARANGNAANAKALSDNQQQQQPSLSRNSSRKAEQSPYRRNPLSEIDPNSHAYPQSNTNNSSSKVQNRPKKEIEAEANQKPNVDMDNSKSRTNSRVALEKGVRVNCKTYEQTDEEIKVLSSMTDNIVVKTVVPSGVDNLKPQTLTRSRSSRRSRDLDLNPEALLNPTQSYTSLLLEDIQNFHQKNAQSPSISLPACLTNACSILEAVADLNSTTSSNFSGAFSEDRRSPPNYQSIRSECNVPLGATANHYGKRVPDSKDPFVESEVVVSDDVMEPSLHKYVTVKRGGSLGGVDMEDQESSGSNSFTVSGWEPNSADSTDCWTSRLNSREEGQKSPLGLEDSLSSEAGRDKHEARKTLNSKRRECDHQHSSGIGRGRLGSSKGLHTLPVVTAAAST